MLVHIMFRGFRTRGRPGRLGRAHPAPQPV